jgi:hypothetical protein
MRVIIQGYVNLREALDSFIDIIVHFDAGEKLEGQ